MEIKSFNLNRSPAVPRSFAREALAAAHRPTRMFFATDPTPTERELDVIGVLRRLVASPRQSQARAYLTIGGAYRIRDGRRWHAGGSNWVHTHHQRFIQSRSSSAR